MRTWKYGAVLALAVAACGGERAQDTGSVSITISGLGGASGSGQALRANGLSTTTPPPGDVTSQVASVVLKYSGPSSGTQTFNTITNPIRQVFNALRVGVYTFNATAYDASATPVALFSSGDVVLNVYKNQLTSADLIMQQLAPGGTVHNISPLISSIVVSNSTPAQGETITLTATVVDATDQLTYQWTSSCSGQDVKNGEVLDPSAGEVFSKPTALTTRFTSYCTADQTITFTATESTEVGGGTASVSFKIPFAAQGRELAIQFNLAPDILTIGTTEPGNNRQPPFGGQVSVVATEQDADFDAMTNAWSDNCGGTFADPSALATTWTAPSAPRAGTATVKSPLPCALTLTVTDARGGKNAGWLLVNIGDGVRTLVKRLPFPRFAYVANQGDGTVSGYQVNANTGALTSLGAPVATVAQPTSVAADPSGKHLYVAAAGDKTISAYAINPTTGALTLAGSPVATGTNPQLVTVDPSGKYVYVVNHDDSTISIYAVDAGTGALTISLQPVTVGKSNHPSRPYSFAFAPSGNYAYSGSTYNNVIYSYSFSSYDGKISPFNANGYVLGGVAPRAIAADPLGRFFYVVNDGDNTISSSIMNAYPKPLGPPAATGSLPRSVAIEPSGTFVYVANAGDGSVSIYKLDAASGVLTGAGSAATGNAPSYVTVDPSGKFAYVANQGDGTVSIFTIDASTGALTSVGAPTPAGVNPASIAITGVYPPPMAYAVNYHGNSLSAFALDPVTGAPTSVGEVAMGPEQGFEPNGWTQDLAVDPLGRFVFVPHFSTNEILVYAIDPITGALTSSASVQAELVESIAIDPSGRFLYAGNRLDNNGTISEYSIDPTTGALTFMGTVSAPLIEHMVVDPSGSFVYALTGNGWYLSTYEIDPITGLLTFVNSVDSYYVKEIAIDPFGRFLYTTTLSSSNPTINSYALDAVTGVPSLTGRCPTGTNAMQMWSPAVHPTGRFAYAIGYKWLSTTSSTRPIYVYSIDPGTGTLTITSETIIEGGSGAARLALDPSGNFLYAVTPLSSDTWNQASAVVAYAVDASTGALTKVDAPSAATGLGPTQILTTAGKGVWISVPIGSTIDVPPSSAKDITRFTISGVNGTISGQSIAVTLPVGTDVTSLAPTIAVSAGATVSPASGSAQDFTNPVVYTVTAADASTQQYTVTVTLAEQQPLFITSFVFRAADNPVLTSDAVGVIGGNHIAVALPNGTAPTSLVPTITASGGTVSPASGAAQSFLSPVTYTVTDGGRSKQYAVSVATNKKNIILFSIDGVDATISTGDGSGLGTITLAMPCGTSLTSLAPLIGFTGESVSPASGSAVDFSSSSATPVVYTVTGADDTTKLFYATITAPCP